MEEYSTLDYKRLLPEWRFARLIFFRDNVVAPRVENSNFLLQDLRDLCPLLGITG
jgi:hypothetical protein